jgi:Spy/CpxP family protein refolding chaperone
MKKTVSKYLLDDPHETGFKTNRQTNKQKQKTFTLAQRNKIKEICQWIK